MEQDMTVNLINFGAVQMPLRKHYDDFGADVFAQESCVVAPHSSHDFKLGFGIEVPLGLGGYIEPRGSMGRKGLLPVSNPIDSGYRGEVHAVMWNMSNEPIKVEAGERIAQLVLRMGYLAPFRVIEQTEATTTERGTGCYGSTGK